MTDFGGKTSIFSHPVYLFLRKFSLQDSRGGSVRYFGFLANRVCGEKLPQVYRALGMDKPEAVAKVCYAQMVKQFLSRAPFECVLCGGRMVYRRAIAGLNVSGLKKNARDISLLRYMPA